MEEHIKYLDMLFSEKKDSQAFKSWKSLRKLLVVKARDKSAEECDWCVKKHNLRVKLLHSECYEAILNGEGMI